MNRTGIYVVLCVSSISGVLGLYRHTYSACYGITTDNFIKASCPGADEKMVMDAVYAYAKPLSAGCPEVMTSAANQELCCQYDAGDCGFEYDGFNKNTYFENCHGRTTCSWTPVAWANAPCNSTIYPLRTNFMAVYFYCISENDVKDVSDDGSINTTTALLLNPGYESGNETGSLPANSSYKCSVSASCATSLKIRALNLNFTENGGICGQSLTITDGTNTQVLMCDSNTNYIPFDLNIGNNTQYLEIHVNNTLNTDSGYFLLQIGSDHGDDTVTLACGTSIGEGKVPAEDLPECSNVTTNENSTDTTTVSTDNNTDITTVSTDNNTDITTVSTDNNTDITTVSTDNNTDITTVSTDNNTDITTVSTDNNTDITTVSTDNTTDITTVSTDNNTDITTVSTDNNTDITTVSTDNNTDITTVSTDNNTDITTVSTDNNTDITTVSTDNNTDITTVSTDNTTDNTNTTLLLSPTAPVLVQAPTQQLPAEDEGMPSWIIPLIFLVVLIAIFVVLFLCKNKIKDLYIKKCKSGVHPDKETVTPEFDENALFASFEKPVSSQVAPASVFISTSPPPALNGLHKLPPLTSTLTSTAEGEGEKTENHKRKKKKKRKSNKKKNKDLFEETQIVDPRSSIKSRSVTVDVVTVT